MAVVPKIAVIILNWNGRDDTLECVTSVSKIDYANFEVIVVDNGSTDGSVEALRERFPDVTLLETGKNLGFAGGNNLGIEEALRREAGFVLLLNNDARVHPGCCNAFVEAAQTIPDAGAFAGKICDFFDRGRIWFAGARWMSQDATFEFLGFNAQDNGKEHNEFLECDFLPGCFIFFKANVLKIVGFLDPRFFLLFEEVDWCYRARSAGYRCIYVPKALAWHRGSISFGGKESPLYQYFYVRNRLLWAERHLSYGQKLSVWKRTANETFAVWDSKDQPKIALVKHYYWKAAAWVRALFRDWNQPVSRAKRLGLLHYLCRKFGDCPARVRNFNRKMGLPA